ncbi:COA8 family protein Y39B6A.34, mitochondrial [Aphelenchoides bicaudatus]|nr:COA8 family protein Y39B6A.34, mitochondrial [Aphelenchoides bicaudatus]
MVKRKVKLDARYDWLGPPDQDSKIRPIQLRQVANETNIERSYRLEREKLNRFNSTFWAEHNRLFEKSKASFIEEYKKKHGALSQIDPNKMSEFYTSFLSTRKTALAQYNRDWYRGNAKLIWPAIKVNVLRFLRLFRR